jgi:hypothetical protein
MARLTVTDVDLHGPKLRLFLTIDEPEVILALPRGTAIARLNWNCPGAPQPPGILRVARLRGQEGSFRAVLPMPAGDHPLHGLAIEAARPEDRLELAGDLAQRLARLYPIDAADYVELFQSAKTRWGDRNTRYFLAGQITRFFTAAPEHRIGASLVMGYKAVEIGEPEAMARALETNGAALTWLAPLDFDPHPRRNREHLEISLLSARWHLQLATGDIPAARDTLRDLLARCASRRSYWTLAYSACKSLALAGWLEWRGGEPDRARECWERCVAIFKEAVREADPLQAVIFKELTASLAASHLAGLCLRAVIAPSKHEMPPLAQVLEIATRVPLAAREGMQAAIEAALPAPGQSLPTRTHPPGG